MAEKEVIIKIGADTGDAASEVSNLKNKIGELNDSPLDKPFKSFKAQIKEATIEAQKMAEQFGQNSKQFADAAKKVANLKDEFSDLNATVGAFNPDNKLQALSGAARGAVGALQGATGAMAFLGVTGDTAAETMAKLQGLMAFSEALNSVDDIKNSFNNFGRVIESTTVFQKGNVVVTNLMVGAMRLLGITANTTSTAFRALKVAIAATGIGLLVVAIGTLLPMITEWITGTDAAEKAQRKLKETVESLNEVLALNKTEIEQETKINEERLKQSGATEKQLLDNRIEGLEKQWLAERDNEGKLRQAYIDKQNSRKKLTEEELAEGLKLIKASSTRQKAIQNQIDLEKEKEKTKNYEDEKKKREEADKKESDRLKAAGDKSRAEAKARIEAANALEAKLREDISKFKKTEREKDLIEEELQYQKNLAVLVRAGHSTELATEAHNKKIYEIVDRYDKEAIAAFNDKIKESQDAIKKANEDELKLIEDQKRAKEELGKKQGAEFSENEKALISNDGFTFDQKQQILDADRVFLESSLALAQYGEEERTRLLKENSEARKLIDEKEKEHKLANLDLISSAADAASDLIGKNTVAGKALAVASTTISTYEAAQKAYASQMSVPDPSAPVRAAIAAGIAIVQGLARVKGILSVKVPSKSGGSAGSGSASSAPTIAAPQINSTMLQADLTKVQDVRITNPQTMLQKTYISSRDLQEHEDNTAFLNNLSRI